VINPNNTDEECIEWAVIAALHKTEIKNHSERVSKLEPYVERYNWNGLEFPMAIEK